MIVQATDRQLGRKLPVCHMCGLEGKLVKYANNGVLDHGKLSVNGPDLVDEHGEKFQLVGISTHGLQWFGHYVNYATLDALHNEFGINVIRLAMYTAEGGYCESDESKREYFYQLVGASKLCFLSPWVRTIITIVYLCKTPKTLRLERVFI